jgi:dephospho-CoA kinase
MNHVFGITGSIACGKSTVTRFMKKNGIPIVDADIIAREVVVVGSPGWGMIRAMFGHEYLLEDESIDRPKLGQYVFSNKQALYNLNAIMSPLIQLEAEKQINVLHEEGYDLVGYDAALIIESGNASKYAPLVVVTAPFETQLLRLMSRNSLTEEDARNRISKQLSSEEKAQHADLIIETTGTLEELELKTLDVIDNVKAYFKGYDAGLQAGFNVQM